MTVYLANYKDYAMETVGTVIVVKDLYEEPLDPGGVRSVVEQPPHVVTQHMVLPETVRQAVHACINQGINLSMKESMYHSRNK